MALRLNTESNVGGRALGLGKRVAGAVGMYDPAAEYAKAKNSFVSTLSRFAGERGVLTDADVSRAAGMLPNLGDSPQLTRAALKRTARFLEARLAGLPDPYLKEGVQQVAPRPGQPASGSSAGC
jgi:hypothetical protein